MIDRISRQVGINYRYRLLFEELDREYRGFLGVRACDTEQRRIVEFFISVSCLKFRPSLLTGRVNAI